MADLLPGIRSQDSSGVHRCTSAPWEMYHLRMAAVPFSTQALAAVLLSKRHVEEQYGFRVPVHAWIDGFTRRRCGSTRNGAPGYVEGEEIVWAVVSAKLGTAAILFHVTSAYVILRHNGVKIGKKDHMGAW